MILNFKKILPLIFLLTLFSSSCSTTGQRKVAYTTTKDIVFKTVEDQKLTVDLYLPNTSGPNPTVLVVHGGGWKKRSGDMESICRDLAKNGYAVFNTTYRLAPKYKFPKPVDDVRDSIQWIKDHAAEYHVDTNRMVGWGYSAGAHLILLAGLDPKNGLKAIVAGGSPANLSVWPDSSLVNEFLGSDRKSVV